MVTAEEQLKIIYELNLMEYACLNKHSSWLRVPGGWVYGDLQGTVFIPYKDIDTAVDL